MSKNNKKTPKNIKKYTKIFGIFKILPYLCVLNIKLMTVRFFDFWFSDFSWYRKFTKRQGDVWYQLAEEGPLNQNFWVREDKFFPLKLQVMQEVVENYPNLDLTNESDTRKVAEEIIKKIYPNEQN